MANKLTTWNQRAIELMKYAIAEGLVKSKGEWCEKVGMNAANLSSIERGERSLTIEQLLATANLMNKPMDYFFDRNVKQSGLELIKQGVRLVELDSKGKQNKQ